MNRSLRAALNGVDAIAPSSVAEFLRTIDYPATPDDLARAARHDGVDDAIVRALSDLPARSYDGAFHVLHALDAA
ncbi:DUF2795 domain-containing protein [Agromyces atrinae]|uniref:DUF2795 domain-containing protein n=1 Tax=Agromyces atrinae TaxID=592376 RepID=UPI001F57074C|nr:DUF2795 domain-containing protein [Agromyces atrinae]MCI2959487.1 DUF2795 domain-containing protein [Agromyces atrinae]